ncbi:YbjQ family protein [Bifidobacterium crudilactis]|uniref:YbjQ family protein n=1 Tax=Bifidobacterium crudilactis TaxID=327277 RepID=UPI001930AA9F|nr:YbjQ family protein [Bifidobacterium crudilactis]MCI2149014.1 YbjQ family protein [Bifidobacterium crudilactis]MCI2158570.1 YbjQ family protein [Bifidobacterium crudilactis]
MTTQTIAGMTISEVKGAIFTEQVIAVNAVKDTLSGIKGIFGGRSATYSEEYSKGRELALAKLAEEARGLSANAILAARVSYSQFINSDIMLLVITASGTAAVVEEAPALSAAPENVRIQ